MAKTGSLDHLIRWLATKPADEKFAASAKPNCLFCQYGDAASLGRTYEEIIRQVDLTAADRDKIVSGDRTFGLALERAQKLRAHT